jgi:hypothetical protein
MSKYLNETDVVLAVERAMVESERIAFLDRVLIRNPHLNGAHVADMIAMMLDGDADLETTEAAYELFYQDRQDDPRLFTACVHAVRGAYGTVLEPRSTKVFQIQVRDLIDRASAQFPQAPHLCDKEAADDYLARQPKGNTS